MNPHRTFEVPDIPDDVRLVSDVDGTCWVRGSDGATWYQRGQRRPTGELLVLLGPLTEVCDAA